MANTKFQIKRSSISGRLPNTSDPANTSYIDAGELAINLTDEKVFSSNGTVAFEVGANLSYINVSGNATINAIIANGNIGTNNQVLVSNGQGIFWSSVAGGGDTLTNVNFTASNSTLTITTTATAISQTFNYANSSTPGFIQLIDSTSNSAANIAASANSVKVAFDAAGNSFSNATAFAANADNITSGTLNTDRLPATANISTAINVGANVNLSTTTINVGNSTVNSFITSNAASLGNTTITGFANISSTLASGNTTVTGFINVSSTGQFGDNVACKNLLVTDQNVSPEFKVHVVGNVDPVAFSIDGYETGNPAFITRRALGNVSSPSAVTNNTLLFTFGARGYTGSAFTSASPASITVRCTEDWTPTATGCKMDFGVVANGTISRITRLSLDGTSTFFSNLSVTGILATGNTTVTGFINVSSTANIGGVLSARANVVANGQLIVANVVSLGNTTVTGFANVSGNLQLTGIFFQGTDQVNSQLTTTDKYIAAYENQAPGFTFVVAGNTGASQRGVFKSTRSRGTLLAPTVPLANDDILSLLGAVYDGDQVLATGEIKFIVDGTVSDNVAPQAIVFSTGNTNTRIERTRIDSRGVMVHSSKILVGNKSSDANLGNAWVFSTETGPLAARSITAVDTSAAMKLVRVSNSGGPIVDFQSWDSTFSTLGGAYFVGVGINNDFTFSDRISNTTPIFISGTNNNIGFGTVTPTAKVEVVANTTSDAFRITQTGTGNALVVTGFINVSSTLAAGNTTVTGFVNTSVSVNSALITVGTSFIANTNVTRTPPMLIVSGGGGTSEGGQIVLGYGNNLATAPIGQANNTWNIDVIGGNTGSTPLLRVFAQHNNGTTTSGFAIANTGRMHVGVVTEQTDSTFKVTGSANVTTSLTVGTTLAAGNTTVNGSFAATTKSFVIPHPTKKGKKLRYGSLEGPENGVYVRGKTTSKIIKLPSYWTKLVHADSITVHLTAIEEYQQLFVEKIENNKVYIKNKLGAAINCFYTIYAERMDVEKLIVEIPCL